MTSSSDKQKRYDRQLRLWGEHGQACMEECTVCLINGTGCGAEALKNLVLPGKLQTSAPLCGIPG
jgi:amyloid beta precursor protein binding protein 1